jgi:tetratricopeptide (TPR) repeat protein
VPGTTLRGWQAGPRSRAEIIDAYAAAGRGLAAAHRVHVVHRDFKPDNVLVTEDGSIRVVDFGLAVPMVELDVTAREQATALGSGGEMAETLARSRALAGTPAYMAPEQIRRAEPAPAADQFSFSVALFQALTGARPFAGTTLAELLHGAETGRIVPNRLPRRLLAVLRRGLATDPADRFPSMDALLVALTRATRRRSPRLATAAGSTITVAAALAFGFPEATDCLDAVDEVEVALGRAGPSLRGEAGAALVEAAQTWVERRHELCVGSTIEAPVRDRWCSDKARHRLLAALGLAPIVASDSEAVREATLAADRTCSEHPGDSPRSTDVMADVIGLAADEIERDAFADPEVAAAMALARTWVQAGRHSSAREAADVALTRARASGDSTAAAAALYLRGRTSYWLDDNDAARADLQQTFELARADGDDEVAARAATQLVLVERADSALEEAWRWAQTARSLFARLDQAQAWLERTELEAHTAMMYAREGRYPEAVAGMDRCIAAAEVTKGPEASLALVPCLSSRGFYLTVLGRTSEAIADLQRAIAVGEANDLTDDTLGLAHVNLAKALAADKQPEAAMDHARWALHQLETAHGGDHHGVAGAHSAISAAATDLNDVALADEHARLSLEMLERVAGPAANPTAHAMGRRAATLAALGRFAEAEALRHRMVATLTESVGAEHLETGFALVSLGKLLSRVGRPTEAIEHLRNAVSIHEREPGVDPGRIGSAHLQLGVVLAAAGRPAQGIQEVEAAVQIWSATPDPGRDAVAELERGRIELIRERPDEARAALERAMDGLVAAYGERHRVVAEARVALARALAAQGQPRPARHSVELALEVLEGIDRADALFVSARLQADARRGRVQAEEAAALFAAAEAEGFTPARRAEVEAWLDTRRR